uniref:Uncharacterized protein n=1 Tax=Oryza rufipogon TaxID=4529 RepID=A0A0E0QRC4_ORYRU
MLLGPVSLPLFLFLSPLALREVLDAAQEVLKTCGTTPLLRAVPVLLRAAAAGGLSRALRLQSCRYSCGECLFPEAQPFPHADFADEVAYLDGALPCELLLFRHSAVMLPSSSPGASHRWHVYLASSSSSSFVARRGSRWSRAVLPAPRQRPDQPRHRRRVDGASGIGGVVDDPRSLVCAYAFVPCGYSMNALDGHSYASYECVAAAALASIRRAIAAFR